MQLNGEYAICTLLGKKQRTFILKRNASKQKKKPNEMPEVSAMNRYYWDCPGMQSIPRFHWRQVGIQRKQLGLRGSSAEHPHECRKRSAVQVSKP